MIIRIHCNRILIKPFLTSMGKLSLFILSFLVFGSLGLIENNYISLSKPLPETLQEYYTNINLARRAVYSNDFIQAAHYYNQAFQFKEIPFFGDLKNAMIINHKIGAFEANNTLIRIILLKTELHELTNNSIIPKRILHQENFDYLSDIKGHQPSFKRNKKLRSELEKIPSLIWEEEYDKAAIQFIALHQEFGFPTEEKIGIISNNGKWAWNTLNRIMRGILKSDFAEEILSISESEFYNGNIPAGEMGSMYQIFNSESGNYDMGKALYNSTYELSGPRVFQPFIYYSDSMMNVVNGRRLAIGLDSFHISQRQFICQNFCCHKPNEMITMGNHHHVSDSPYGFVKSAFEKEGIDLSSYLIDIEKIAKDCDCEKKGF